MEPVKVVIRYANGKLIKGYTNDFFPNKPMFHVRPTESQATDKGVEVYIKELKGVFFVRDFTGNRSYNENKQITEGQQTTGKRVKVTFKDKEALVGTTLGYDPGRPGFFITPIDPQSNNLRIFVVSAAVNNIVLL